MRKFLLLILISVIVVQSSLAIGVDDVIPNFIPDAASLEAMINNHKKISRKLTGRFAEEAVNDSVHGESARQEGQYRAVSDSLDRKTRNLDYFVIVLNGVSAGFHTYRTYRSTLEYIEAYVKLVNRYRKEILQKGRVWDTDYKIFDSAEKIVKSVKEETGNVVEDYITLAAVLTGNKVLSDLIKLSIECSTENCIMILDRINDSLDRLHAVVQEEYNKIFLYLGMRLGYYTKAIYQSRDLMDILADSKDFWLDVAQEAWENTKAKKSTKRHFGHGGLIGHSG